MLAVAFFVTFKDKLGHAPCGKLYIEFPNCQFFLFKINGLEKRR
jgi:hypothetical protein